MVKSLVIVGDIHFKPEPETHNWVGDICLKPSLFCTHTKHWIHLKCKSQQTTSTSHGATHFTIL